MAYWIDVTSLEDFIGGTRTYLDRDSGRVRAIGAYHLDDMGVIQDGLIPHVWVRANLDEALERFGQNAKLG